jgi:UDP-glucose 4-epimerase
MTEQTARFRKRKVLVTGGAGFIGSNLVRELVTMGAEVAVIDCGLVGSGANPVNLRGVEDRVTMFTSDLRDMGELAQAFSGCDFVFHLAAQTGHLDSMKDPVRDLSINALGTTVALESCRKHCPDAVFVLASTRQLYGPPVSLPVSETHPLHPPDVNAVGKLCAEELLGVYARIHGIKGVRVRLTNTYGPRMRIADARQMFLGIWIRNVLNGTPVTIFGDGKQRRDLVFVRDVVEALLLVADSSFNGRVFNIGSDESIELRLLAEKICMLADGRAKPEFRDFPPERKIIDIGDYVGDYRAIKEVTGWCSTTTLDVGLRETLDYYRLHADEYLETK